MLVVRLSRGGTRHRRWLLVFDGADIDVGAARIGNVVVVRCKRAVAGVDARRARTEQRNPLDVSSRQPLVT